MAITKYRTLVAVDEWAEFMEIPGWLFSQVTHPARPQRGGEMVWLQSGYYSDPNRIAGRDSVGRALMLAERKMADHLSFWPAPTWICDEPHEWIYPKRGSPYRIPEFRTNWGYLISAGVEAWDLLTLYPTPIEYSDEDGDNVLDWAKIEFDTYLTITDICEIEVVPPDRNPEAREWRIRPLTMSLDAGVVTIEGPRWLFVDPDVWLTTDSVLLSDNANFLTTVDLYRHYNDTTQQAEYKWQGNGDVCSINAVAPCAETCQDACVTVRERRTGIFYPQTATWGSGTWVATTWAVIGVPSHVNIWYYSGYDDDSCYGCDHMGVALKEAICRLANVYLPEVPCGKGFTRERWEKDRDEMEMTNYDVALAQSAFGTTARGAVFARSVAATLPPLGQGG